MPQGGFSLDTFFDTGADATKASMNSDRSGYIHFIETYNLDNIDLFLQLFDLLLTDVTVGTTAPKLSLLIPAGNATTRGAMDKHYPNPLHFQIAVSYAVTTTPTGNTAPVTTNPPINFGFRG